jgi:hypothetical protein
METLSKELETRDQKIEKLQIEKQKLISKEFGLSLSDETNELYDQLVNIVLILEEPINNCDSAGYKMGTTLYNSLEKFTRQLELDLKAAGIKGKLIK